MQHIPCVKADSIPRHFLINIEGQIPYLGVGLETGVLQHIISFNGDSIPYGYGKLSMPIYRLGFANDGIQGGLKD